MTGYVNFMAMTQVIRGGVVQTEGNPVADAEAVASAGTSSVVPDGCNYVSVWADVASTIIVSNVTAGGDFELIIPANTIISIPNVTPNKTTVTVTDLA